MRQPVSKSGNLLAIALMALLIGGVLAACSVNGGDEEASGDDDAASRSEEYFDSGDGAATDAGAQAMEAEDAEQDAAAPSAGGLIVNQIPFDRLVIRTARLTLTVESVPQATNWVRDLATRKNGFVFSSNTYVQDESEYAEITIRVPSDQYDSTILELRDHELVVQVDREESTAQDVSQEYVDNEARLEALEETQRRYLMLLAEADDIDSILRIESELTQVRSQIETIKGRQNYLDQMTAYSTITVTLHVENGELPDDEDDDGFIATVFTDSWERAQGFIEGLAAAVVTLGIISLAVLPLVALGYLAYRLVQRRIVTTRAAE